MKSKLRRNRIISRLIILLVFAFILLSLLVCCGNGQAYVHKKYVLLEGETLWSLYEQHGNGMKYAEWEYEMLKWNGKEYGDMWYAGEEIILLEAVK